jgi:SAM-dependent methyltransferase
MLPNFSGVAEFYNTRFESLGRSIGSVGWGSYADQSLRFDMLFRGIDIKGKVILDVGCGLGDLVGWLDERTGGDFTYIGVDIAAKLLNDARKRFGSHKCQFLEGEILGLELPQVDISVLSGTLSAKMPNISDYAQSVLLRMYELSQDWSCANFLSTYVDFELEKNQHYRPEEVFTWARQISSKINLFHDYPLYEFTLQIARETPMEERK